MPTDPTTNSAPDPTTLRVRRGDDPDPTAKLPGLGVKGAVSALGGKTSGESPFPTPLLVVLVLAVAMLVIVVLANIAGPAWVYFENTLRSLGWTGAFFSGGGM